MLAPEYPDWLVSPYRTAALAAVKLGQKLPANIADVVAQARGAGLRSVGQDLIAGEGALSSEQPLGLLADFTPGLGAARGVSRGAEMMASGQPVLGGLLAGTSALGGAAAGGLLAKGVGKALAGGAARLGGVAAKDAAAEMWARRAFTFSPKAGFLEEGAKGYAVSRPGTKVAKTASDVRAFMAKHEAALNQPGTYVGGVPVQGGVRLELSTISPTLDHARKTAARFKQEHVYDLETGARWLAR